MNRAAFAPWRDQALRWWGDRSPRERGLLGILAGVAIVALLTLAVIRPLVAARARAMADIRSYDSLAARLRAAGPGIAAGRQQGAPATIVSQTAAGAGLTITRIEPEGGRLRVAFADAPYDVVLGWVAMLERSSALRIGEARIDRATTGAGGVSSSFLIAG